MKKFLIGISIILFLFIIATLLAPFMIDLNRYKGAILDRIRPYINREIDFESIDLMIVDGLGARIKGVRIADNTEFSDSDFLAIDSVQVRVEFMPLLQRRIRVMKIILNKPSVRISRDSKGRFNVDGIIVAGADNQSYAVEKDMYEGAGNKDNAAGILAALLISKLEIENGRCEYKDEKDLPDAGPIIIDRLDIEVRDLSLNRAVPIMLAADITEDGKQDIALAGTFGPVGQGLDVKDTPFDMRLETKDLPVDMVSLKLPVSIISGLAGINLSVSGSLTEGISAVSDIRVSDLIVEDIDVPSGNTLGKTGPISCSLNNALTFESATKTLYISSGMIEMNGNRMDYKARMVMEAEGLEWDIDSNAPRIDPDSMIKSFPMYSHLIPKEIRYKGPLGLRLSSSGNMKDIRIQGALDLSQMDIAYRDIFNKPAKIPCSLEVKGDIRGRDISLRSARFALHDLVLDGSGEIRSIGSSPIFNAQAKIEVFYLKGWEKITPVVDPYRPEGSIELWTSIHGRPDDISMNLKVSSDRLGFIMDLVKGGKARPGKVSHADIKGMTLEVQVKKRQGQKLRGSGSIGMDTARLFDVDMTKIESGFQYTPGFLTVKTFRAGAFQGDVQAFGVYDISTGDWSVSPVLREIDCGDVLNTLTEYRDVIAGKLSGKADVHGNARVAGLDSISAEGLLDLARGQWNNFDLAGGILDDLLKVEGIKDLFGLEREEFKRHKTTRFDLLRGNFEMGNKIITLRPVRLVNIYTSRPTDSIAELDGDINLNDNDIDMKGSVTLSRKQSQKLIRRNEALSALFDDKQRIMIPVRVKGTLQRPIINVDTKDVGEALTEYYTRKGLEKGIDRLKDRLGIEPGDQGTGEVIDRLLEGILDR